MESDQENIQYPDIAQELNEMATVDQEAQTGPAWWEKWEMYKQDPEGRSKATQRLQKIVLEIGWPSIPKVGKEASRHAWLLAQHADHDVQFQKHCLELMKELPDGKISERGVAYLEDRVRKNEGRLQLYGTQVIVQSDDRVEPNPPVEDPDHLDERRALMGLESFEEYAKRYPQMLQQLQQK